MLFGDSYGEEVDDARCFFGISTNLNFRLSSYTIPELLISMMHVVFLSFKIYQLPRICQNLGVY
jgi:hypothetical protein